jgi:hypothetical protein
MARVTTEIVLSGLISAKTFNYLSRLGTFLRGTLLSIGKPVKTQKDELLTKKKCGRARTPALNTYKKEEPCTLK